MDKLIPMVPEATWLDDESTIVCPVCAACVGSRGFSDERSAKQAHSDYHYRLLTLTMH